VWFGDPPDSCACAAGRLLSSKPTTTMELRRTERLRFVSAMFAFSCMGDDGSNNEDQKASMAEAPPPRRPRKSMTTGPGMHGLPGAYKRTGRPNLAACSFFMI
jgi:hypothetical protein